jgi:hypothetical protein
MSNYRSKIFVINISRKSKKRLNTEVRFIVPQMGGMSIAAKGYGKKVS